MKTLKIRVTLLEELLGTLPGDPEVFEAHIASKNPEGVDTDEVESINVDDEIEKGTTVFSRDENDNPHMWDYQVRGFFKEAVKALQDMDSSLIAKKDTQKKLKLTNYSYKRTIDNTVFVSPRKITFNIPEGKEMGHCQRPLRADTMRGERVALANSEAVPAGTTLEFEVQLQNDKLEDVILQALLYGQRKGFGQWRNSGKGAFTFELLSSEEDTDWLDISQVKKK